MSWDETRYYSGFDRIRDERRPVDVRLPSSEEIVARGKVERCLIGSCRRHGRCMYLNHPRCPQ